MLLKLALVVTAIVALFLMIRKASRGEGGSGPSDPTQPTGAKTLSSTQCKTCGIYLPAGQSCDCADRT